MKKIFSILPLLFFASFAFSQPFVLPTRSSTAVTVQDAYWRAWKMGYMTHTHGLTMNGGLDTVGAILYEDSSRHLWYRDTVISGGHKWSMLITQSDVAITGLIQQGTNVTITGSGTLLSPYIINATGGGGGGGNIDSLIFSNVNGFTGVWTNPSGPNATLAIGTSVNGIIAGNGTGVGAIAIGAGLQFVANTLTNTINNTNQLTNGAGFISNITGLVQQGANITITGSGTIGSPYIINGSASGGGITGAGNLSPIFTTSIAANTLNFTLTNANAYTVLGNFTGSPAAPTYGQPSLTSPMFANQGTNITLLAGNAAGNLSFVSVNLSTMVTNVLAAINGGSGQSVYTIGDLLYANTSTTLAKLSDAAIGNVLLANGIGIAPIYGKVNMTSMITGVTPIANGGLNLSSALNGIVEGNGTSYSTVTIGFGIKYASGTLSLDTANLHDTTFVHPMGASGDTLLRASNDTLYTPLIRDSLGFHHVKNADGSWTLYTIAVTNGVGRDTVTTITSGTSSTVPNGTNVIVIDPSSPIVNYSLTLPTTWHTSNYLKIYFGHTNTTSGAVISGVLTIVHGSGQTLLQSTTPGAYNAGESIEYHLVGTVDHRDR